MNTQEIIARALLAVSDATIEKRAEDNAGSSFIMNHISERRSTRKRGFILGANYARETLLSAFLPQIESMKSEIESLAHQNETLKQIISQSKDNPKIT